MRMYLLLIFILITPLCLGEVCQDYSDCPSLDCIGYSRSCKDSECKYSDCFVNYGSKRENVESFQSTLDDYDVQTQQAFGLKPILILAGKVTIMTFVVLVLALLLTVLRMEGALKYIVIILMLLIVSSSVILLFGLQTKMLDMLGIKESNPEGYENEIMKTAKKYDLSVDKRDVSSTLRGTLGRGVESGTEYRLYNKNTEFSILMVKHADDYSLSEAVPEKTSQYSKKNGVYVSSGNRRAYLWEDENKWYFLTGGSSVLKDLVPKVKKSSIFAFEPGNDSYTNQKRVSFKVPVDASVSVGIIEPVNEDICYKTGENKFCEFRSQEIEEGWNWVRIKADNTAKMFNFNYDKTPPQITTGVENKSRVGFFNLEFNIADKGGVSEESINLHSSESLQTNCQKQNQGFLCRVSGTPEEGRVPVTLVAEDKAGNRNSLNVVLFYDTTRPEIEATQDGFRVLDEGGIAKIIVDGKEHLPRDCSEISKGYECDQGYNRVEVIDEAGNEAILD